MFFFLHSKSKISLGSPNAVSQSAEGNKCSFSCYRYKLLGGLGLDSLTATIVSESLAYGCTGITTGMLTNGLAETPLIIAGTEEQKKKFLGRMIEEPLVAVS